MVDFYKRDGSIATKEQFLSEGKRTGRTLGTYVHPDGKDRSLIVHTYYAGIDHGKDVNGKPTIYETTINGDAEDVFHKKYVGKKYVYADAVEAAAKHADIVDVIRTGGNL